MTSTNDIRRSFLDYFEGQGHARVPSAPLRRWCRATIRR
jgi:alanyl-tRNA synthetase